MSPKSVAEPPIGAQLGPASPPGPHVLQAIMSNAPLGSPPSPHSLVRAKPGPCQAPAEALGQEQQSRSQESWGIKLQASGDSGIRLLSPGCRGGGRTTSELPPSRGHNTPRAGLAWEPPFKEEPGPPDSGPSCPLSQPGFAA